MDNIYIYIYIHGIITTPLTNSIIFQDGYCTTNQIYLSSSSDSYFFRRVETTDQLDYQMVFRIILLTPRAHSYTIITIIGLITCSVLTLPGPWFPSASCSFSSLPGTMIPGDFQLFWIMGRSVTDYHGWAICRKVEKQVCEARSQAEEAEALSCNLIVEAGNLLAI